MRLKVIKKLVDINILYSSKELIWLTYERSKLRILIKRLMYQGKLLRSYLASKFCCYSSYFLI